MKIKQISATPTPVGRFIHGNTTVPGLDVEIDVVAAGPTCFNCGLAEECEMYGEPFASESCVMGGGEMCDEFGKDTPSMLESVENFMTSIADAKVAEEE